MRDGLHEVLVEADLARAGARLRVAVAGRRDQEHVLPSLGPDPARDVEAVHAGQPDVEHHDLGIEAAEASEPFVAVLSRHDLVPVELEHDLEQVTGVAGVLDDEDAQCLERFQGGAGWR